LEVLNKDPKRKESDTSPDKKDELSQNYSNNNPIAVLSDLSQVNHHGVSPIEQQRNTLIRLFRVEFVGGDVVLEDPVFSIDVVRDVIRFFLEPETICLISKFRSNLNVETVRLFDEETQQVGLVKYHSEINHLVVVLELGQLEVSQGMVEFVSSTLVIGGISPEYIEHQVEVFLQPSEIDGMGKLDGTL
jgi:hypothetical protein